MKAMAILAKLIYLDKEDILLGHKADPVDFDKSELRVGLWWWRLQWENLIQKLRKSVVTYVSLFSQLHLCSSCGKDNKEHHDHEGADVPIEGPWGGEYDVPLISAGQKQVESHIPHINPREDINIQGVSKKEVQCQQGSSLNNPDDDIFNVIENVQVDPTKKVILQRVILLIPDNFTPLL